MKGKKKMIIGQFSDAFPPITDGVAQVVKNYAKLLNTRNNLSYVITPVVPEAEYNYTFPVITYKSLNLRGRKYYRLGIPYCDKDFNKKIKKINFDIIHAHSPFVSGKIGKKIANKLDVPFIATFHSKYRDDFKQILKFDFLVDRIIKRIVAFYESADEVWTVSKAAIDTLRDYGYRGEIFVMENACDFTPLKERDLAIMDINTIFNLDDSVPLFVYVGQHIWQKNIRMIIKSLNILNKRGKNFKMLFIGDGDKKNRAEEMINDYGLSNKVSFTGNIYDRDMLKKIYARSLAVFIPSLYDTSSLVIKEAAALETPVIVIRDSTISQGINDGVNGFLINNNPRALADKTMFLIKNMSIAKKAGEKAKKTLYRNWEDIMISVEERYEFLLNKDKGEKYDKNSRNSI